MAGFLPDGSLDHAFGANGVEPVRGNHRTNSANGDRSPGGPFFSPVAIRPEDGDILLAGGSSFAGPGTDPLLSEGPVVAAAFRTNGKLDRSFGTLMTSGTAPDPPPS